MKRLIVLMGVSASGKSTIASKLSEIKALPYLEGDEFHPETNIKKMSRGIPLTNTDRKAWIDAMAKAVAEHKSETILLSCSALNTFVRNRLKKECGREVTWIYLKVSRENLDRRIQERENHFMQASLLNSQLSAMEPPNDCLCVDANKTVADIVDQIDIALSL